MEFILKTAASLLKNSAGIKVTMRARVSLLGSLSNAIVVMAMTSIVPNIASDVTRSQLHILLISLSSQKILRIAELIPPKLRNFSSFHLHNSNSKCFTISYSPNIW